MFVVYSMSYRFNMDSMWIPYGFHMDCLWLPYGSPHGFLGHSVWVHYGFLRLCVEGRSLAIMVCHLNVRFVWSAAMIHRRRLRYT